MLIYELTISNIQKLFQNDEITTLILYNNYCEYTRYSFGIFKILIWIF